MIGEKKNLNDPKIVNVATYNDGNLALWDDWGDIRLNKTIQPNFFAIVLCIQGKASVHINGNLYVAGPGDLFVCMPDVILNDALISADFRCHCIGVTADYIQRIVMMTNNNWNVRLFFESHPFMSLAPSEVEEFCHYYNMLCRKAVQPSRYHREIIDGLITAFFYDMRTIMDKLIQSSSRPFTSGEHLFKCFIDLLVSMYPKNRRVSYYADRLHVTPKYLAAVCKNIGKKTPSQLIDLYMVKDIEYLLTHTSKSIKEIAIELDFPTLSFFGKYVRQHLGASPKAYREEVLRQPPKDEQI